MNEEKKFKIALVQMNITTDKQENINTAVKHIIDAKNEGAHLIVLPECFNSPYGEKYFAQYAEEIPNGETSRALSEAAKKHQVYIAGGSFPEREGKFLYNTSTVWGPDGNMIAKHRKIQLFDMDIPGVVSFNESSVFKPGDQITVFDIGMCKVGIAICYDLRFPEIAGLYRKKGAKLLLYPGAFDTQTGPLQWELLLRSRAIDNQIYVAGICGSQNTNADYVAWGHTTLVNPWGQVSAKAQFNSTILYSYIDLNMCDDIQKQIPYHIQRKSELYEKLGKEITC